MTNPLETPPNWPRLVISVDATAGTVTLAGTTTPVAGASLDDVRVHALEIAIAHSARIGRPLHANAQDPVGSWELVVYPDGRIRDPRRPRLAVLLVAALFLACLLAAAVGAEVL